MKHKLTLNLAFFSLILSLTLASFSPAHAGLTNDNQYFLLTGNILLNGSLLKNNDPSDHYFSIDAGYEGASSKEDGSYSIRVPGDVKVLSFCYSTAGDKPYNTNSSHCSYLDVALINKKIGDFPLTYSYDFNYITTPGRIITGSILSPNKKTTGGYGVTEVKVYSEAGLIEGMNVFRSKYEISVPPTANRVTFCQLGMDCIEFDPSTVAFKAATTPLSKNITFKAIGPMTLSGTVRDSQGKIYRGDYTIFESDYEGNFLHSEWGKSFSGNFTIPFSSEAETLSFCTSDRCNEFSLKGKYPAGSAKKNIVLDLKLKADTLLDATVMSGLLYSVSDGTSLRNGMFGNIEPEAYVKIKDKVTGKYTKYYANSEGVFTALFSKNYGGLTQCNAANKCVDNSNLGYLDGTALKTPNNNGFDWNWLVPPLPGEVYSKHNLAQILNYQAKGKVFYQPNGMQLRATVLALGSTVKTLDNSGKVIKVVNTNSSGEFVLPLTDEVASISACNSFGFCTAQGFTLTVEQVFTVLPDYVNQETSYLPKVKETTLGVIQGTVKPFLTSKFKEADWKNTITTIYTVNKSGKVVTTKVLPPNDKKSLKDFEFSLPIDLSIYKIQACIKLMKENYCSSRELNPVESKVFFNSPYPFPYQVIENNSLNV